MKISRQGTKLIRNGQQWKFAGLNADTWFGCWSGEKDRTTDSNLDKYFKELNPHSCTRIWLMPNADLNLMDKILNYAKKYGQYVAPVLFNGNKDCSAISPPSYTPGTNNEELAWVNKVVPRFANNESIAFWEIINEPGNSGQLKGFFNEIGSRIKQLDPNTLIGSGTFPQYAYGDYNKYKDIHNLACIDLISIHEYDAATGMSHWAGPAIQAAKELNKPWYAGEDGFTGSGGNTGSNSGNAGKLKAEMDAYINQPECAGMMYWDFKWAYPEATTINFNTPMWETMKNYRHAYHGS